MAQADCDGPQGIAAVIAAAKRGHPPAIAALINQALPWPGVRSHVYWLGSLDVLPKDRLPQGQRVLVIDLLGEGLPAAAAIVTFMRTGLQRLDAPTIAQVRINARIHAPTPGHTCTEQWSQLLHLSPTLGTAPPTVSTPNPDGMGRPSIPLVRPRSISPGQLPPVKPPPHRPLSTAVSRFLVPAARLSALLTLGTIGAIALLGYPWPFRPSPSAGPSHSVVLLATQDLAAVDPRVLAQGSPADMPPASPVVVDSLPTPLGANVTVPTRPDGAAPTADLTPTSSPELLPLDSPAAPSVQHSPTEIETPPIPTPEPELPPPPDPWQQAISHALQAAALNQRARFRHEWEAVATHWQQAIAFLHRVPRDHVNSDLAQQKIGEYSRNLAYASGNVNTAIAITLGHPEDAITVKAVGDMVPGVDFPSRRLPPNGGRHLFDAVRPALGAADLVLGNFESTLTTHPHAAKDVRRPHVYAFRTPPSFADILRMAGFDVLSVANNHSMDFGLTGFQDTIRHIEAAGMKAIGQKDHILYLERKGVTIALIGFSYFDVHNSVHNLEAAKRLVRQANEKATIVIISVHMGAEGTAAMHVRNRQETFFGELRGNPVLFSRTMIDAGADLILGHGPHVPRALELYGNKLIAYSLGNFVGYGGLSSAAETGYSLILEVQMNRLGNFIAGQIIPVHIDAEGIPTLDRQFRTVKLVERLNRSDFPETPLTITPQGLLQRQS